MRKWTHVQKLRAKMQKPVPDESSYIHGGTGFGRKRVKNKTRIPPRYRFLLRYASNYPAEIEWHLRAAIPRMWSVVQHELRRHSTTIQPEKVFKIVLGEHMRIIKVMKRFASADDALSDYPRMQRLTEKQRDKLYSHYTKIKNTARSKVYQSFYHAPKELVKILGKEKALEFWKSVGHTIFIPDWDSVYRWMDSYRRD